MHSPEPAPQPEPAKERSFASLFGWKAKPAEELAQAAAPKRPAEEETFDDDLEIPAFLRRSGQA